jgi:hypothetical protein
VTGERYWKLRSFREGSLNSPCMEEGVGGGGSESVECE